MTALNRDYNSFAACYLLFYISAQYSLITFLTTKLYYIKQIYIFIYIIY